jgi:hypothetical protein
MRRVVVVKDKMQQGYRYELSAPAGRDFDPQFQPDLTPEQMLELGVFGGRYFTDCRDEFPASWFARAKLSPSGRDCSLNYFGVDASQPLSEMAKEGLDTSGLRQPENLAGAACDDDQDAVAIFSSGLLVSSCPDALEA